jgi:hypothetical protein
MLSNGDGESTLTATQLDAENPLPDVETFAGMVNPQN